MTSKVLLISTRAAQYINLLIFDLHSLKSIRKMSEPSRRDGDWGFLGKLPLIEAKWRDGGERVDVLDAPTGRRGYGASRPTRRSRGGGGRRGGAEERPSFSSVPFVFSPSVLAGWTGSNLGPAALYALMWAIGPSSTHNTWEGPFHRGPTGRCTPLFLPNDVTLPFRFSFSFEDCLIPFRRYLSSHLVLANPGSDATRSQLGPVSFHPDPCVSGATDPKMQPLRSRKENKSDAATPPAR